MWIIKDPVKYILWHFYFLSLNKVNCKFIDGSPVKFSLLKRAKSFTYLGEWLATSRFLTLEGFQLIMHTLMLS
jgi:hypothetical protein